MTFAAQLAGSRESYLPYQAVDSFRCDGETP